MRIKSTYIIAVLSIACVVCISLACKKLNIKQELRIDLVSQFKDEQVTIKLDDKVVFSDQVTTLNQLSVAKIVTFDHPIGRYEISVTVNGTEFKDKFRHKKDCYLIIYYNEATNEISVEYPKEKNVYD